jgi:hypothetical protein
MTRRLLHRFRNRHVAQRNTQIQASRRRVGNPLSKRGRRLVVHQNPFSPPEDWHEPTDEDPVAERYRIVVQSPGQGYRHVVTPAEIRARLALLPQAFLAALDVVQLSRVTRKKRSYPCYGMQWGRAIYLYPMEEDLVETYLGPPTPAEMNEARMYGGCWEPGDENQWRLRWTEATIKDFYLNNVLIHELGHILDNRNTNARDRERYAEWFAIHHGYRPTRQAPKLPAKPTRRHHRK